MWNSAIAAYLHYSSFMLAFAALTLEGFTLKQDLSLAEARKIMIADGVYGAAATTVLITGILRVLYFGQGKDYYLSNPVFYIKVGIFLVVGALSLYPTFSFLSWLPDLRQGKPPTLETPQVNRITWLIRAELVGLILIPILAAMLARGLGFPAIAAG